MRSKKVQVKCDWCRREFEKCPSIVHIDNETVLEVKGYMPDRDYKKYMEFTKVYPELTFIIVGGPKRCEEICDIYIPWKEREKLIEVLS